MTTSYTVPSSPTQVPGSSGHDRSVMVPVRRLNLVAESKEHDHQGRGRTTVLKSNREEGSIVQLRPSLNLVAIRQGNWTTPSRCSNKSTKPTV